VEAKSVPAAELFAMSGAADRMRFSGGM